jgi:hypothetical protein
LTAQCQEKDSIHTALKPSVDSVRAIPISELKTFLKITSDKRFNDSLIVVLENQKGEMQSVIVDRDHRISTLRNINEDFRTQIANKEELIVNGKEEVKVWKARLTREKTYTALVVLGWLGTTFYFVTK